MACAAFPQPQWQHDRTETRFSWELFEGVWKLALFQLLDVEFFFMQALIKQEEIGKSLALRDFLAYEGDANIAFVKKANEVPRIDKVHFLTLHWFKLTGFTELLSFTQYTAVS